MMSKVWKSEHRTWRSYATPLLARREFKSDPSNDVTHRILFIPCEENPARVPASSSQKRRRFLGCSCVRFPLRHDQCD